MNTAAPSYALPQTMDALPIFPLAGALLLPGGDLPLNIFEKRYLAMVRAAMQGDRLIGMIQPCEVPETMPEGARPYYAVGCVGRIEECVETDDGRFLIVLTGISRFRLLAHTLHEDGYRTAQVDFTPFDADTKPLGPLPDCLKRPCLVERLAPYLEKEGLAIDWDMAASVPDHRFYTLVTMVCPFSPPEKQALLEAETFEERCRRLKCLLDIACAGETGHGEPIKRC